MCAKFLANPHLILGVQKRNLSVHQLTIHLFLSSVLTVCVRPDGGEVAIATLDCCITFFDVRTGTQTASVEGLRDLVLGRRGSDKVTAKTMSSAK